MPSHPDLDAQLISAARQLVERESEAALTVERLARACGVARATLYRRYGGRAALERRLASAGVLRIANQDDGTGGSEAPGARERILRAVRGLVLESGSLDVTIAQVAQAARVGPATVYRHFGSKENLLACLAREYHPRQAARELLARPGEDVRAELTRFAGSVLRFMQSRLPEARLLFTGDPRMRELFASLRADQERTLDQFARYLDAQVRAGRLAERDPFDLATAFFGQLIGFAFLKPNYTGAPVDPDQAAAFIVDLFLSGLRKEPPHDTCT